MSSISLEKKTNLIHYYILKYKSFSEICSLINISAQELLYHIEIINSNNNQNIPVVNRDGMYKIQHGKKTFKVHNIELYKSLKLMIVSDKHNDSQYTLTAYEEAEKRGIDYVIDLGDITSGPQNLDICADDRYLEETIYKLKRNHVSSIPTLLTTGNHDIDYMKTNQCDIGRVIERECKNIRFLNNLFSCLDFGGIRLNVSHGSIENKRLRNINLNKEYWFLNYNNPHIICQAHFHLSDDPICSKQLLFQIPALRHYGNTSRKHKNKVGINPGVVFLTLTKTSKKSNQFEVLYELEEYKKGIKSKVLTKEMRISS